MDRLEPGKYGLPNRTVLYKLDENHIAIVKDRKSRIIMKDGDILLQAAEKIRKKAPGVKISIMTNAPVCSKTRAFLDTKGVDFTSIE